MKSQKWLKLFSTLALAAILIGACAGLPGGETLVWIDVPLDGLFAAGIQTIDIDGHATSPGGVSRVELWANGALLTTIEAPPADGDLASFHFEWTPSDYGDYTIQAIAFGASGTVSEPDSARVFFDEVLDDVLRLCAADELVAPLLVSPADGATVETNPVLAWTYPNEEPCLPQSYGIDISTDASFSDLRLGFVTLDNNETSRSWPLPAGGCYYWRVQAYVPGEYGPMSDAWSFCVVEPEITPTATFLPREDQPLVQFWADPAQIQAGACTTIQWHVENVQSVIFGGIEQPFDGSYKDCLCKNERYTLTVNHLDGRQEKHTVDIGVSGVCETPTPDDPTPTPTLPPPADTTPPSAPSPVVPANGLVLSCRATQTLAWLPVSDPSGISGYYVKLEIETKPGVWVAVAGYGPITGKQVDVNVQCGGIYRWMVRAQDGAGNYSDWSAFSTFSIILN